MGLLKTILDTVIAFGPVALFFIGFLDSIGVPLVGGVDALVIGVAVKTPHLAYLAATTAMVGSIMGNLVLFRAARYGGRKFAREAAPEGRRAKFQRWFHRYGLLTVFIPGGDAVRAPSSQSFCGFRRRDAHSHATISRRGALAARVFRYFGEAYLGIRLGRDATGFLRDNMWNIVGVALALALVLVALIKWQDRRRVEA